MNINNNKLKNIDINITFFFLLTLTSLMSFYIIINKKRELLNLKNIGKDNMNKLFQYSHYIQIIVNIYFVINAYNALEQIKNNDNYNEEEYNTQLTVLVSNVLFLIASIIYLPIINSKYILTR